MRFKSRRNKVYLRAGAVIKEYTDAQAIVREADTLRFLSKSGLAVPKVLQQSAHQLVLEYIEGSTYLELVEKMTSQKAEALAEWLAEYNAITNSLRGDVNLRNFIWSGNECVGIDFEEPMIKGDLEEDFGKIIAYAVTYNPAFSANKFLCGKLMLKAFLDVGGAKSPMREAYLREIDAMNIRRNSFITQDQAATFFMHICQEINSMETLYFYTHLRYYNNE